MIKDFSVVDLFCGIGGLTHGFVEEKFNVVAGIDFDNTCKYAYETNNGTKFLHRNISDLKASELEQIFGNTRKILIGCAPCQPYSIFNRKKDIIQNSDSDPRWKLLYSFSALIKETRPEIISMENVPLLKNYRGGQVFNDFVRSLEDMGYFISYDIFNAQDYGVPQRRKRLVLLGSLHGKIEMVQPTHSPNNYVTVRDAIGHLPPIEDGEVYKKDKLHRARKLTEITKRRIKATKEGGSWKDWDDDLKLDCHKKKSGEIYRSVYGRMQWDNVAPTMTTYCVGLNNGRFGHPDQDRAISLREAALIQSFPSTYDLIDMSSNFSMSRVAKHIGNAVPVLLGRAIAKSIKVHINSI